MRANYLDAIKSFEGFTRQAKWDYAQNSNGFGTQALYPNELIDEAEAKRRFAAEIEQARMFVEKQAPGWDEGTKAALTSLTFNAGTRWTTSGLGDAVRNFDIDAVREKFLTYTKAGGQDLPGLVRRRLMEVTWIGETSQGATATFCRSLPSSPDLQAWAPETSAAAPKAEPATIDENAPKLVAVDFEVVGQAVPGATEPRPSSLTATTISAARLLMLSLELRTTATHSARLSADAAHDPRV